VLSEADTHSYTITDKENGYYVAYSVQFQSDAIDEATEVVLRSLTGNQIECHNEEEIEQFVSLFDLLISEINNESDDFNHISHTILKIIILMAQRLKPCSMTLNKRNAVSSEISYINRHFKENITLKQVSEYTGYSSVYFSKLFKVRYGMTFSEYLCNRRLNYARDVLLATNYSATEVAEMCGFNTITHFSKAFKRKFGISPRTFRNNRNA
jgi:YesN/AraC family two-component response regulator